MKFIFIASLLFVLCNCSHRIASDNPENDNVTRYGVMPADPITTAAVAGVSTGIAMSNGRGFYKTRAIVGECLCKNDVKSTIEFPCAGNIVVSLTETKSRKVSDTRLAKGEFAFEVKRNIAYRLAVTSDQYQMTAPINQDLFLGADMVIHLVPKAKP